MADLTVSVLQGALGSHLLDLRLRRSVLYRPLVAAKSPGNYSTFVAAGPARNRLTTNKSELADDSRLAKTGESGSFLSISNSFGQFWFHLVKSVTANLQSGRYRQMLV